MQIVENVMENVMEKNILLNINNIIYIIEINNNFILIKSILMYNL